MKLNRRPDPNISGEDGQPVRMIITEQIEKRFHTGENSLPSPGRKFTV